MSASWERQRTLFTLALENPPETRTAFLDEACGSDADLRRTLDELLLAHESRMPLLDAPSSVLNSLVTTEDRERARRAAPALDAGAQLLGRFEIVRFLGAGGMGEVYEAFDRSLDTAVALKVLPTVARDIAERFRREVALARKVTHPNVCRIFDLFVDGERVFLTMELLHGETLSERLRRGAMAPAEAHRIALQILSALSAAHDAGVIHRDLKPGNVMLVGTPDGMRAVVTDFGLATSIVTMSDDVSEFTHSGQLLGTLAYMAPEQLEGLAASAASDIYAAGLILHQMLTGRLPFRASSPLPMLFERLRVDAVVVFDDTYDERWRRVILRCLERKPEDRFPTAHAVGEALAGDGRVAISPSRRRRVLRVSLVGSVAVTLASIFFVSAGRESAWSRTTRASALFGVLGFAQPDPVAGSAAAADVRVKNVERLTADGRVIDAAISSDGSFVAYSTLRLGTLALRLLHVGSGSDVELLPARDDRLFTAGGFSADGNFVYFRDFALTGSGHRGDVLWDPVGLVRLPLLGGTPQPVQPGWYSKLRVSPDGTKIAFVRRERDGSRSRLVVADGDLRGEQVVAEAGNGSRFAGDPAWSGDSRRLVVAVADSAAGGRSRPLEVDIVDRQTRPLNVCADIDDPTSFELAPSGGWFVQSSPRTSQLWHVSPDGARCSQLTDGAMRWQLAGAAQNGALLARGTHVVQNIWRASIGGGETVPERLTQGINTADGARGVAPFPDGTVVFSRSNGDSSVSNTHLWIVDAGSNVRRVTQQPGDETDAVVSPDARLLLYTATTRRAENDVQSEMRIIDLATGESRQLVAGATSSHASFSSDGAFVYFADYPAGSYPALLRRVSVEGSAAEDVTPRRGCDFIRVSPDARWMACMEKRLMSIVSMADGAIARSFELPRKAAKMRWLPDSSAVTYVQHGTTATEIWAVPRNAAKVRRLARFTGDEISGPYAWLPDGRSFVFTRASEVSDAFLLHLDVIDRQSSVGERRVDPPRASALR